MQSKKIGKVSATEKNPCSCDEFTFWLDDKEKLSPFDIIKVENNIGTLDSITYGVVQEIYHITDSPGHISNYVSSDFGNVDSKSLTQKLGLCYATVSVIHNDKENYMPVKDGAEVYTSTEEDIIKALGLDIIPPEKAIPAGILKTSNDVIVPINFSGDFLIGPEGAHLNISGISGLATKTSYAMFILQAIQQKIKDTAIVILNVKGSDLLRLNEPNSKINEKQKNEWVKSGVECKPFDNVSFFYPFKNARQFPFSNSANDAETLKIQFEEKRANNFVYTYDHDKEKIDLIFSNIDDPNFTIESIINYISESRDFEELHWDTFKDKLKDYCNIASKNSSNKKEIPIQSWRKFTRLINNAIHNDVFQSSISGDKSKKQVFLSEEIKKIKSGETYVVDIAKLEEQLQCLVFGDIIKSVYEMKHGDVDRDDIPKRIIIFVDELNKYAPSSSSKNSPILNYLIEITERGRSEGVILFSAQQFKSSIFDRVKGNCSTHIYGRSNAIEISKSDYKFIPNVYANMMTRLGKGDLIIQHPVFKTLLKVNFPYPSYNQGAE